MLSFPRAKIPLVVLLFLVLHLTVLSRLRIGGAAPDVMLLLAIAAGVVGGPQLGALLGFSAGLVLDLFLETPLGLSALVFCLVGYGVGNIQASEGLHRAVGECWREAEAAEGRWLDALEYLAPTGQSAHRRSWARLNHVAGLPRT